MLFCAVRTCLWFHYSWKIRLKSLILHSLPPGSAMLLAAARESVDTASSQGSSTQAYVIFLIYSSGHENVDLARHGLQWHPDGREQTHSHFSMAAEDRQHFLSTPLSSLHVTNST